MNRCIYCECYMSEKEAGVVLGYPACPDCVNNFSRPEDPQTYDYQAIADAQGALEETP